MFRLLEHATMTTNNSEAAAENAGQRKRERLRIMAPEAEKMVNVYAPGIKSERGRHDVFYRTVATARGPERCGNERPRPAPTCGTWRTNVVKRVLTIYNAPRIICKAVGWI